MFGVCANFWRPREYRRVLPELVQAIDYKRELPGGTDADKKEFLADVSSFANTSGGDLVFGMDEAQGVPTQITGFTSANADAEIRRLESIVASGLDPRIRYSIRVVTCGSGEKVLIMRTERSWVGPHRLIFKGHDKFYARNSAGKYALDVDELRDAFTLSSTVTERIRAFRTDRIIAISNNETPVPFTTDPKVVLHCIPLESFVGHPQYDVLQFDQDAERFRPLAASGAQWTWRINLNGIIVFNDPSPSYSYTQLYRNGVIEVVNGGIVGAPREGKRLIPHIALEKSVWAYLPKCFALLQAMGARVPVAVALSLTTTRGLEMPTEYMSGVEYGDAIQEQDLILPETVVPDFGTPAGKILKPVFDMVWNATGRPHSTNFDANGNWVGM